LDDEREASGFTKLATEGCADKSFRRESRSILRIVEDAVQPMCHGSLGLQVPAAAADVFYYAIWRSARGEMVVLRHGVTGYEIPVAGCCADAYPYGARSA